MKLSYEQKPYEISPPLYYGFCYFDTYKDTIKYYVFPINYIVRLCRVLKQWKNDTIKYKMAKAYEKARAARNKKGVNNGT